MISKSWSRRRGNNAIEFALILPALVAIMFGLFEYSWYFNRYLVVSAAARDAARRTAMVTEDDGDYQQVAEGVAFDYLDKLDTTDGAVVSVDVVGVSPTRTVTVSISRPYTPIAGALMPAPSTLSASFTLRMEDQL